MSLLVDQRNPYSLKLSAIPRRRSIEICLCRSNGHSSGTYSFIDSLRLLKPLTVHPNNHIQNSQ